MKKFIALSLSILLVNIIFANNADSKLYISFFEAGKHTIKIDCSTYVSYGQEIEIPGMNPGFHNITIIRSGKHNGYEHHNSHMLYSGCIDIPRNSEVYTRLNKFNDLVIKRIVKIQTHCGEHSDDYGMNSNGNNWGLNLIGSPDVHCGTNNSGVNMSLLMSSLEDATFDSDQLKIAKQAVMYGGYSSSQTAQITEVFSFESTKLKFAKFAFDYVRDPQNYFLVNKTFIFSSSISSLNSYILNHH